MRVILVGDQPKFAERVNQLFDDGNKQFLEFDYEFGVIENAQRALNDLDRLHPDLVLLDCGLKEPTATSICQKIRERETERHMGIIFVDSNHQSDANIVECLELGGDDWVDLSITDREIFARINAVLRLKAMTDELRSANHRLKMLSNTDELTGLHNMRSFNQHYLHALRDCRDEKHGMGVIMLDLDHFKSVNDSTNHLVGSFVISQVGRLIKGVGILSSCDVAARYGGDEYVIFTLDKDIDGVFKKAEAISRVIRDAEFVRDEVKIKVTASIGVSWVAPGFSGKDENPIKAADLMLYKSKHFGRNCIHQVVIDEATCLDELSQKELDGTTVKSTKKVGVAV